MSLCPSRPASGDGVDADDDAQRRLVDGDDRQRARVGRVGERLADRDVGQAGDGDELARAGLVGGDAVERLGDVELGDLRRSRSCRRGGTTRRSGPCAASPWWMRQIARRPTYGEASRFVTCACSGCVGVEGGRGDRLDEQVEQRLEVLGASSSAARARPGRPSRCRRRRGKSIWSSSASRSRKSSSTSWTTSSMRASGRSTLLTTRTIGSRASSALRSTKRVWGSGPSLASTSSSTPSTIVMPRSTSPPKSAWPGVSTMLIFVAAVVDRRVLGEDRDAALALLVHRVHDPVVDAPRPRGTRRSGAAWRRPASSCRGRRGR